MAINQPKPPRIVSSRASAVLNTSPESMTWDVNLLAAWLLLLRDYYGEETPGFKLLRPTSSGTLDWTQIPKGLKAQSISMSIKPEDSVTTIQRLVSEEFERENDGDSPGLTYHTGVLTLRDDEVKNFGSQQQILKIFEGLNLELLLTVVKSGKESTVSVWGNSSSQRAFSPCRVLRSFTQVFERVSSQQSTQVDEIESITDLDIEKMHSFNFKTDCKKVKDPECLHALINTHYTEHPEKIALSSTAKDMTYHELGQISAAIAHFLGKRGTRPGDVIGICLEKSVWTIATLLGVLRAGAAYVPMDPSYPPNRVRQIIEQADIRRIVANETIQDKLGDINADIIFLPTIEDLEIPDDWTKELDMSVHNPAYIIFTSGSTGIPKGAVQQHQAVSISLIECIEAFGVDRSTRFMQFSSLAFDASIMELWSPLVAGGCVCVPSEEERSSDLEMTMRSLKVTDAWLTAGLAKQLRPENLPDLRRLSVGGEALSEDVLRTWSDKVQLNNVYGTTETGVWDTMKNAMKAGDNPNNIGRGIGNVACWISDPSNPQRLRPVGAEGELLIQSSSLALGYLKAPELSASVFLHPSSLKWGSLIPASEGSRIYRTGDMAKFNADGDIVFVGRQSGFIKIRGLRVDLSEVEHAINSADCARRSAIVLPEAGEGDVEMVAFVETTANYQSRLVDDMHDHLSETLPTYMIPSVFIPMEKLPLTTSGKLDRQRLRSDLSRMSQKSLQSFRRGGGGGGGDGATTFSKIPATRSAAIEISCMVADQLSNRDEAYANSLRGKNFPLETVGLSSMRLASLTTLLRKKFNKKIKIGDLRRQALTVCDVEDLVSENKHEHPDDNEARNLIDDLTKLKPKLHFGSSRRKTIFLTSITGFLGSQILRSLLQSPEIEHIIGLVRAKSKEEAMEKVEHQAKLGKWWKSAFRNRIEIWLGDLSKPQFGLEVSQRSRLWGRDDYRPVDGIIHNGARVNWMESYQELELVNVHSTIDILSGLSEMESPCPLIYISGGYMPSEHESIYEIAQKLSSAPGYDQTKFVSELLLGEYNKHLDKSKRHAPKARTIIPGFIVGTRQEGIAHQEDFLWRLSFSISRLQAVSMDLLTHINVAGVDQVSDLVSDALLQPDRYSTTTIKCYDGVNISTLCNILEDKLDIQIRKVEHAEWMRILRTDIDEADFDHPFAPVFEWLQSNSLGTPSQGSLFNEEDIVKALERSVEYLKGTGYFSDENHRSGTRKADRFTRSSC
ncbi:hypothetical protein POX_c04717 [Penicillium oxalicum]|uniref:hypothetical protein n=1 Tax=Penicillium oxalicum TaxID=69781 RepID=UPI0020B67338|nr:hypothetical protein POX_c04717 [Penicillium oxalicum]KAI2791838.1 hypothetical protein POX_c04717 [Penicillium oxalicum]